MDHLAEQSPAATQRAQKPTGRVVVLACGNTLRGDDGVGWQIGYTIEDLALPNVEVILTQQLLPEHSEALRDAGTVVFVDCSALTSAGTVSTISIEPAPELPRILTHHFDPASLLKLTSDLFHRLPQQAVAVTVGGVSFEMSEDLSPDVAAALPSAITAVRKAISRSV
jgi:hydrogenase maturation protease